MTRLLSALLSTAVLVSLAACSGNKPAEVATNAGGCPGPDSGIVLPPGFCATIFADNLGHTRHMVVGSDGTLYVNSWSGTYFRGLDPAPPGGYLVALRDDNGDGAADSITRFGPKSEDGATGGMGIALYNHALYAEAGPDVVRYDLTAGNPVPTGDPVVVLSGLATDGDHNMHPIAIDSGGNLFVNTGSATNACQVGDRQPGSPGIMPCKELEHRAGIWRYDAKKTGQKFSPAERYATGLRNAGGLAFSPEGQLFATQHGRDQLSQLWPAFYTVDQGADSPLEELMQVTPGADFGWPYCYFDHEAGKLLLAPEYGGDNKKEGQCTGKTAPVATFPAHMAPIAAAFYSGTRFPQAYKDGVFIAFHGSWNRAPLPQQGYDVWFQPMASGKPSGEAIIFADGFAAGFLNPGQAKFRPSGLAVAPDGALYIADDVKGRIWRITYSGSTTGPLEAAPPPPPPVELKEGELPPPPTGFTKAQLERGRQIFLGQAENGTCSGCHGADAKGSSVGPTLITERWMHGDGSVDAIAKTIDEGVAKPKEFTNSVMPPKGGSDLSPDDERAIAAYLYALNHPAG